MKIAFCGDSFCADTGRATWPRIVKEKLNATRLCKGKPGANQYTILKNLKKIVHLDPDLVIFTHTEPYRLPNRHDEPLGARPCATNQHPKILEDLKSQWKDKDKVWIAGHMYYEHLMDFGFMELSYISMVKECVKICEQENIKFINLFSFSTHELGMRDYNWDLELPHSYREKSLARISYDYQEPDNHKHDWIEPGWKTLPNHMNYEGNQIVSDLVLSML